MTIVSHCNTVSDSHTEHRFIGPQIQGGGGEGGQRLNYVAFSVSRRQRRWWWIYLPGGRERGETRDLNNVGSVRNTNNLVSVSQSLRSQVQTTQNNTKLFFIK